MIADRTFRRALRRCLRVATLLALAWSGAQAQSAPAPPWQQDKAWLRLGYETVRLPGDEAMGLLGTSYLVEARRGLCIGPAIYGAISGQRGGLFVVGGEAALCTQLADRLSLVAGLFVGGGGGGSAPVGGGLMLRPHADLLWDFGSFRAGVSVSSVNFPNGQIDSSQVGLIVDFPTHFGFRPAGSGGGTEVPARQGGGMGFDRVLTVGGVYFPRAQTMSLAGQPLSSQIGYIGARAEKQLGAASYAALEANAALGGAASGYAELLGSLGARTSAFDDRLMFGARVALGMGGGGLVPVGGGLLAKASIDASVRLSRDVGLQFEAGYASAPQGDFRAPFASLALMWNLAPLQGVPSYAVREEFAFGAESYADAQRKQAPAQSLQSVSVRFNRFVGETVYVTGQVQSAYDGEAGGFAAGLLGGGARWQLGKGFSASTELLLGAAGGGGVDGGGVVKPMVYVGYALRPSLLLQAGAGHVWSIGGSLNSNVFALSLVFPFDVGGLR